LSPPHTDAHARAGLDLALLLAARTRWHTPAREHAVARFSRLGEHGAVWFALGAAGSALDRPRRRSWERAGGVVALAFALNSALKLIVRRPRPTLQGLPALTDAPTRLSFPSAHASTSFAGALAYSRLGAPAPALYALAGGLSLSRLYLGMHYPSDVLAGALFGSALAAALTQSRQAPEAREMPDAHEMPEAHAR